MLATLGDLVEDIVVGFDRPMRRGSDTPSVIARRRGGSAANVADTAARLGRSARFIGQVGDDRAGEGLVADLAAGGVDTSCVVRRGSTSAIVVLVDQRGERTMLTDRRASTDLSDPQPSWLDGVTVLHVPFYSFVTPPLSDTTRTLVGWANDRGIPVSIDLSSRSVLEGFGLEAAHRSVGNCAPAVVFANADEAQVMGVESAMGEAVTVVKRGARPALVHRPGHDSVEVAAIHLSRVTDTTAAGDAFAAGFLSHRRGASDWRDEPVEACADGHRAAAALIRRRG